MRAFQQDKGLAVDGIVGDQTWAALIDAYMAQDQDVMTIVETQLLPNAKDGCDGGKLKWLGCGEEDPVKDTEDAWRPNRRVEILFVQTDRLPCDVPKPVTFEKPAPGSVNSAWCLGPDTDRARRFRHGVPLNRGNGWFSPPSLNRSQCAAPSTLMTVRPPQRCSMS